MRKFGNRNKAVQFEGVDVKKEISFDTILVEARILAVKKFGKNREDLDCFDMVLEEIQDEFDEKYHLKVGQLLELENAVRDGERAYKEALLKEEAELEYVVNLIKQRTPEGMRPRSTNFKHGSILFPNGRKVSRGMLSKALDQVQKKRTISLNNPSREDQLLEKFVREKVELVFPGLSRIELNFMDNELVYDGADISKDRIERILFKMINERRKARKKAIAA